MPNNKEFIKKNKKRGLRKIPRRRLNNQKIAAKEKSICHKFVCRRKPYK